MRNALNWCWAIAITATLVACEKDGNSLLTVGGAAPTPAQNVIGVAQITFRDVGLPAMTSDAIIASSVAELESIRAAQGTNPTTVVAASIPIQIGLVAVGSFTLSPPSGSATRFLRATFGVRNLSATNIVFDRSRENLTFVGIATASTIGQTAVRSLLLSDGSPANQSLATSLTPTGLMADDGVGGIVDLAPNIRRTLTAADVAKIAAVAAASKVFTYGFVVRSAPPEFEQFDGDVTFSFSLPAQLATKDNPSTISVLFLILQT